MNSSNGWLIVDASSIFSSSADLAFDKESEIKKAYENATYVQKCLDYKASPEEIAKANSNVNRAWVPDSHYFIGPGWDEARYYTD